MFRYWSEVEKSWLSIRVSKGTTSCSNFCYVNRVTGKCLFDSFLEPKIFVTSKFSSPVTQLSYKIWTRYIKSRETCLVFFFFFFHVSFKCALHPNVTMSSAKRKNTLNLYKLFFYKIFRWWHFNYHANRMLACWSSLTLLKCTHTHTF